MLSLLAFLFFVAWLVIVFIVLGWSERFKRPEGWD